MCPPTTRRSSTVRWGYPAYPPLLAAVSGLLSRRSARDRHRLGHRARCCRGDLQQLQLGRRRRQHQRRQGREHRSQLRSQQSPGQGGRWQHDASHRQGVAYRDNATREKFAGQTPGADGRSQYRGRGTDTGTRGGATDRGSAGNRASVNDRSAGGASNRGATGDLNRVSGSNRGGYSGGGRDGAFSGVGGSGARFAA